LRKIFPRGELAAILAEERAKGRTVAFANGLFDLLHVGHVRYLEAAAREADLLVVGINSDASARRLKGPARPLVPAAERAEIVAAFTAVDYVCVFDEPTADATLEALRPDVHCKGTDYTAESVPERDLVLGYGGRIAIVGDPKDHATRDLIREIVRRFGDDV
jgi:rfaE bifunctional protein nucleotidyltransferase chain/domain